eukprot:GDKJ01021986.1.p1 GENE.GDKJ01021986.1~~GDKJ01021986.1.p1  ORF type:complete len:433 (+),score=44.29 GDKJ01021986.1:32-1330(+)
MIECTLSPERIRVVDEFACVKEMISDLSNCVGKMAFTDERVNKSKDFQTITKVFLLSLESTSIGELILYSPSRVNNRARISFRSKSDTFPHYIKDSVVIEVIHSFSVDAACPADIPHHPSISRQEPYSKISINYNERTDSFLIPTFSDQTPLFYSILSILLQPRPRPPILVIPQSFSPSVIRDQKNFQEEFPANDIEFAVDRDFKSPLTERSSCPSSMPTLDNEHAPLEVYENDKKLFGFASPLMGRNVVSTRESRQTLTSTGRRKGTIHIGTLLAPTSRSPPNVFARNSPLNVGVQESTDVVITDGSVLELLLDGFPFHQISNSCAASSEISVGLQGALLADVSCLLKIPPRCLRITKLSSPFLTIRIADFTRDITQDLEENGFYLKKNEEGVWARGERSLARVSKRVAIYALSDCSPVILRHIKLKMLSS